MEFDTHALTELIAKEYDIPAELIPDDMVRDISQFAERLKDWKSEPPAPAGPTPAPTLENPGAPDRGKNRGTLESFLKDLFKIR